MSLTREPGTGPTRLKPRIAFLEKVSDLAAPMGVEVMPDEDPGDRSGTEARGYGGRRTLDRGAVQEATSTQNSDLVLLCPRTKDYGEKQ